MIVCSFGKWKLIDLGYGGFVSSNESLDIKEDFDEKYSDRLSEKLDVLDKRLKFLYNKCNKIKKELSSYKIIHKDKKGINVLIGFESEKEKSEIIKYCNENSYEYTLCPRYIRVDRPAVSIEVKRLGWTK